MAGDRFEEAKERIVDVAIDYCAQRPGSGPADDLRDAIDDLVDLVEAVTLATFAQAALNAIGFKDGE